MTTTSSTSPARVEGAVQISILLLIGGMAGAASFTHVHDWTMHNVPAGTGDWFGWANAVISELTPLAAGLEIRRRKHAGRSIAYPMGVLIAAVALSLSAQVAEAKPGPTGWLLAAVPALAFLAMSKLVLTRPSVRAQDDGAQAVRVSADVSDGRTDARPDAAAYGSVEPVRQDRTAEQGEDRAGRTGTRPRLRSVGAGQARTDRVSADTQVEDDAPRTAADKATVVAELAEQIRTARTAGEQWQPHYGAMQARTGRSLSWCEKAVRAARTAAQDGPAPSSPDGRPLALTGGQR